MVSFFDSYEEASKIHENSKIISIKTFLEKASKTLN